MKLTPKKQSGFTLIEIVIVLAIAALIMVIVFLAVAGAQRAQRDDANKSAAGQSLAQAEQYLANSSGVYPTGAPVPANYLSNIKDSSGANPTSGTAATNASATARVIVIPRATCSSSTTMGPGSGTQAAVSWWSESANGAQCINN